MKTKRLVDGNGTEVIESGVLAAVVQQGIVRTDAGELLAVQREDDDLFSVSDDRNMSCVEFDTPEGAVLEFLRRWKRRR